MKNVVDHFFSMYTYLPYTRKHSLAGSHLTHRSFRFSLQGLGREKACIRNNPLAGSVFLKAITQFEQENDSVLADEALGDASFDSALKQIVVGKPDDVDANVIRLLGRAGTYGLSFKRTMSNVRDGQAFAWQKHRYTCFIKSSLSLSLSLNRVCVCSPLEEPAKIIACVDDDTLNMLMAAIARIIQEGVFREWAIPVVQSCMDQNSVDRLHSEVREKISNVLAKLDGEHHDQANRILKAFRQP